MRCKTARDDYFKNHDGVLNEVEKMKLQDHLNGCSACASFAEEMDRCLELLSDLPDVSPSENFEWNLKRRILEEKSRMIRRQESAVFGGWQWGLRFVASAAAVALIILSGVWFALERGAGPVPGGGTAVRTQRSETPRPHYARNYDVLDLSGQNSQYSIQTVSGSDAPAGRNAAGEIFMPLEYTGGSSRDSIVRENELLKRHIQSLETENRILKQYLSRARSRR